MGKDTLHTPGYLLAWAIWRPVHNEHRQCKFSTSNILFIQQDPVLWFHIPAVPTEKISKSVKQNFCRSQPEEFSTQSQVSEAIPISHLVTTSLGCLWGRGRFCGHHSCRVTVTGWTLPWIYGTLVHSSSTVAAEKGSKQTVGWAISLSHESIINNRAVSAWALGWQPQLSREHDWKIPWICCQGHRGETRWGLSALQPKALLCIPPGCCHSRSMPHLVPCCPQPGVTARGPRALALGQLRSTARQKLIKSNWKQLDLIQQSS